MTVTGTKIVLDQEVPLVTLNEIVSLTDATPSKPCKEEPILPKKSLNWKDAKDRDKSRRLGK